jgi:hypothetical protein
MADYRAGDYKGAAEWLRKGQQRLPPGAAAGNCKIMLSLFLALCDAHGEAPQREKARAALGEVTRLMARHYPKEDSGDLADWINWLHCQIIRREAEGLLEKPPAKDAVKPMPRAGGKEIQP